MGFSSIGAFIMLFFSLLIIISTFVLIYSNLVESTNLTYNTQHDRIEHELHTSIEIENISVNTGTTPDTVTIYITNTGTNKIDTDYLDVYIDGMKIPRDNDNRTMSFAPGSTFINPLQWDSGETLKIDVYKDIDNSTHVAQVTTQYSVKDLMTFSG